MYVNLTPEEIEIAIRALEVFMEEERMLEEIARNSGWQPEEGNHQRNKIAADHAHTKLVAKRGERR
jgi:hypothetical protein